MALLRATLGIIVIVAVQSAAGQMMMVPPMMGGLGPHPQGPHIRVVRPLYQPGIVPRPPFTMASPPMLDEPTEPMDEERLQARVKELEVMKQEMRQQQVELDEKISVMEERALGIHKQIDHDQQVLRRLEELINIHSGEQMRLERLIERQRLVENQRKAEEERLAREKTIEDWNKSEKERQKEHDVSKTYEPMTNHSEAKRHIVSEMTSRKPEDIQVNGVQIRKSMIGYHGGPMTLQQHPANNSGINPSSMKTTEIALVTKRSGVTGLDYKGGISNIKSSNQMINPALTPDHH